jgi:hypothetical protein
MRVNFVILCLGRTGSTHLQSLLDSHPNIRCYGELFTDVDLVTGYGDSRVATFIGSPHDDPLAYLADVTAEATQKAVGFKLPTNSLRAFPDARVVLDNHGLKVIRLTRRNLLALLVSRRLLAATGVPQSTHGSYGDARITLEPERCLTAFRHMEADERRLDALGAGHATFRLTYEELAAGERLDELQGFLGVDPRPLSSWFSKLRLHSLRETVENWDEVERAVRGTPYESFLADAQ